MKHTHRLLSTISRRTFLQRSAGTLAASAGLLEHAQAETSYGVETPELRSRAEVEAVLGKAPKPAAESSLRPLTILFAGGAKITCPRPILTMCCRSRVIRSCMAALHADDKQPTKPNIQAGTSANAFASHWPLESVADESFKMRGNAGIVPGVQSQAVSLDGSSLIQMKGTSQFGHGDARRRRRGAATEKSGLHHTQSRRRDDVEQDAAARLRISARGQHLRDGAQRTNGA